MKSLFALIVAAALAAACSTERQQAANSAQPQSTDTQPAPAPAPPPPAAPAASPAVPVEQPSPAPKTPAAPAKSASRSTSTGASPAAPPPSVAAVPPAPAPAPKPVEPPPPPPPAFKEVTIPAGTSIAVSVLSNLASNTSQVEEVVKGALAAPIVIDGTTAVPKGAEVRGVVSDVKQSGRVKGKASLSIAFDRLVVRGETRRIQTAAVQLEAQDKKSDDVKKGGIGAGLGAVVGGIAGGGTGAAIGAVAGGTGAVLGTKGREIEVPAGTVVNVLMQSPLTVQVPVK